MEKVQGLNHLVLPEDLNDTLIGISVNKKIKVELSIFDEKKERDKKRTEKQNKYYHKLLDIICDYTGTTHKDLHEDLKVEFLSKPWVKHDKEYMIVGSTSRLNTKEFSTYIDRVFQYASEELGLILPDKDYE